MAQIVFTNFASSTLANPLGSSDTSATLAAGTGSLFPSPSGGAFFALTVTDAATALNHEIIYVYGRSGDTLNPIVRAQEGTTGQAWIVGDTAQNNHTAGVMGAFAQKDSPALTGLPTAPTQPIRDNSTKIATTAYADAAAAQAPAIVKGLKISTTGTNATVTVAFDYATLINPDGITYLASAGSISINTATTGTNGIDAGSISGSTWYSVWSIYDGTTLAGLISLSATAPAMPSGYTYKSRIGWIRSDGTANRFPLSMTQAGARARYKVAAASNTLNLPIMVTGTAGNALTPTWIAIPVGGFVPPTATSIMVSATALAAARLIVAPNNSYGQTASITNPPPINLGTSGTTASISNALDIVLESANIYWAADTPGGAVACMGWEDNL